MEVVVLVVAVAVVVVVVVVVVVDAGSGLFDGLGSDSNDCSMRMTSPNFSEKDFNKKRDIRPSKKRRN